MRHGERERERERERDMQLLGELSVLLWETANPHTCGWSICVCPSFSPSRTLQPLPWLTPHLQNKSPDGKSLPPTNSPITCTSAIALCLPAPKLRGVVSFLRMRISYLRSIGDRIHCVFIYPLMYIRVYSWYRLGGGVDLRVLSKPPKGAYLTLIQPHAHVL